MSFVFFTCPWLAGVEAEEVEEVEVGAWSPNFCVGVLVRTDRYLLFLKVFTPRSMRWPAVERKSEWKTTSTNTKRVPIPSPCDGRWSR